MAGVAIVVLLAATVPSPYAVERPGPVVDVLGTVPVEGEDVAVLTVEDQVATEARGQLNLLTVTIAGSPQNPLSWIALIPALFDRSQTIAPIAQFYPKGITVEQREQVTSMQMDASQVQAATAAFREIGLDVDITLGIGEVDNNGPAFGALKANDEFVSVDGTPIDSFQTLIEKVSAATGDLKLVVLRDGQKRTVTVAPKPPSPGAEPRLGVVVTTSYELPRTVDISVPQIGGPSAGLMFGLAIMERMGKGVDLDGLTVSGTGTLSDTGAVGPIGGLTQKAWAAKRAGSDLFLMPLDNCIDVKDFPADLAVAPVATLQEASAAIANAAAGHPAAGIERCVSQPIAQNE